MATPLFGETRRHARRRERLKTRRVRLDNERRRAGFAAETEATITGLQEVVINLHGPSCRDFEEHMRARRRSELEAISVDVDQTVRPAHEDWLRRTGELDRFREREGITRDPDIPENRHAHLGVIALLLVIEFMAGLAFMSRAAASPLDAFMPALIPTASTGFLAFLTALSLGQLQRRHWIHRVQGAVGAVLLCGTAFLAHLLAAHTRDGYEAEVLGTVAESPGAGTDFVASVIDAPFGLSRTAWWLFGFGLVTFIFCVYEWRKADDPHPGLGRRVRKVEAAGARVTAELERVQNAILAAMHSVVDQAESMLRHTEAAVREAWELAGWALRKLGMGDPANVDPENETDPHVLELVRRWRDLGEWLRAIDAIGDIRSRLARPPKDDHDDDDGGPGPMSGGAALRPVERLADTVTVDEAMEWLEGIVTGGSEEEPYPAEPPAAWQEDSNA